MSMPVAFSANSLINPCQHSNRGTHTSLKNSFSAFLDSTKQTNSASDRTWDTVVKPRLDSLPIDEEYRAYTESFISALPADFSEKVLDNMEKILELPQESVADAKQFHLGDHAGYREWYSGWCDELETWLADSDSISPESKEQASMALGMLREIQATQPDATLTNEELLASGNAHSNVDPKALKASASEALDEELLASLGLPPPASPEHVFDAIFREDAGAISFVKSMYDSRYGVGISVTDQDDVAFFNGQKQTRPGAIPSHLQNVSRETGETLGTVHELRTGYSYTYDSEIGEFRGPQYNDGYSVLNAAYLEAMGWSVKLDHNKVPMATAFVINNNAHDISWGESTASSNKSGVDYYKPDSGMNTYEFQTNRQTRDSLSAAIEAFINNYPEDTADSGKMTDFIAKMKSFIEKSFAVDDADVFANNTAKNRSPEKSAWAHLGDNYSSAYDWLANR